MKKTNIVYTIVTLLAFTIGVSAQEPEKESEFREVTEVKETPVLFHKTMAGETVVMISRKYMVKPQDIYEINPEAIDGLKAGVLLKIPADKIKAKLKPEQKDNIKIVEIAVVKKYD